MNARLNQLITLTGGLLMLRCAATRSRLGWLVLGLLRPIVKKVAELFREVKHEVNV